MVPVGSAFSTDNFPINAQKSPRLIKSQYFCHRGSNNVITKEAGSFSALFGSILMHASGPMKSVEFVRSNRIDWPKISDNSNDLSVDQMKAINMRITLRIKFPVKWVQMKELSLGNNVKTFSILNFPGWHSPNPKQLGPRSKVGFDDDEEPPSNNS